MGALTLRDCIWNHAAQQDVILVHTHVSSDRQTNIVLAIANDAVKVTRLARCVEMELVDRKKMCRVVRRGDRIQGQKTERTTQK